MDHTVDHTSGAGSSKIPRSTRPSISSSAPVSPAGSRSKFSASMLSIKARFKSPEASVSTSTSMTYGADSVPIASFEKKPKSALRREFSGVELLPAKGNLLQKWKHLTRQQTKGVSYEPTLRGTSSMEDLTEKSHDDISLDVVDNKPRFLQQIPLPAKYFERSTENLDSCDVNDENADSGGSSLSLESDLEVSNIIENPSLTNTVQPGKGTEDCLFNKGGNSGRSENIPTAHISPTPTCSRQGMSSMTAYRDMQCTKTPGRLSRSVSNRDFVSDIRLQSADTNDIDVIKRGLSTRRWNSSHNLQDADTTADLCIDPTLSETHFPETPIDSFSSNKLDHQVGGYSNPALATKSNAHQSQYARYLSEMRRSSGGEEPLGRYDYGGTDPRVSYANSGNVGGSRGSAYIPAYNNTAPQGSMGSMGSVGPMYYRNGNQADIGYRTMPHDQSGPLHSCDLTHWQQRHQEQLRCQQLHATQMATSSYPLHSTSSINEFTSSMVDPRRLDEVKHFADTIIREKDSIIERQKVKLIHLERSGKTHEDSDESLHFKLQKKEYECASLNAQLSGLMTGKGSSAGDMANKLGKSEYEMRELKASFENDRQTQGVELHSLREIVSSKESKLLEMTQKYNAQNSKCDELQKRFTALESYLKDLPVAADHAKKTSEVRQLKEDKAKYKNRILDLENRLTETNQMLGQKQDALVELTTSSVQTTDRVQSLKIQTAQLKAELDQYKSGALPLQQMEMLEDSRYATERLKTELEKAHTLLESKNKKYQALELRYRSDVNSLEERLIGEENTVSALREEVLSKEQHLKKLKMSVKQLGSQNQDLMEKSMSLEERQQQLEHQLTGEAHKIGQQLFREMGVCFTELQSLVQIGLECAKGQDPNISALLGRRVTMNMNQDDAQPVGNTIQALKYKLSQVHELRKDVEHIRELLSNKYAEEMVEKLNCATQ